MLEQLVTARRVASVTAGRSWAVSETRCVASRSSLPRGMIHNVASDAHDAAQRPPGIDAELAQAGLSPLADWLTEEVPAALLAGGDPPPRPAVALALPRISQRRWWQRAV